MKGKDLFNSDITERQADVLNQVLRSEMKKGTNTPTVSVAAARSGESVYEIQSTREAVRILFISRDTTLLNPTRQTLDGYLQLSEVFDEVHIVVLRPGITPSTPVFRVAPNVWVYIAAAKHWWQTPLAALKLIDRELLFADGFRPDLIVARDPYECAVVAAVAGTLYNRPTQLHVGEEFTATARKKRSEVTFWRQQIAKRTVPHFLSIRTETDQQRDYLRAAYPMIPDIATLPRYAAYEELASTPTSIDLKQKYRQFNFIYLYIGVLHSSSSILIVLDSLRGLLANPRVGLVIVGEGPLTAEIKRTATVYGVGQQVVIEKSAVDLVSYLKTADVLVVTDTDSQADEVVLRGIACGIPLLCTGTPLRHDLLRHGESAYFTDHSGLTLRQFAGKLLNDFGDRKRLTDAAREIVVSRLHSDPEQYRAEYKASIESGLVAGFMEAAPVTPVTPFNTSV